jgi:RNA polymerase sigma-70 factor (ECF subfamily)
MRSVDASATRVSLLEMLNRDPQDPQAWTRFHAIYAPHIAQWCRNRGAREEEIDAITQGVLVRFYRRINRSPFVYDPGKKFRGYMRAMARSAWLDWKKECLRGGRGTGSSAVLDKLHQIEARAELEDHLAQAYDLERVDEAIRRVRERLPPDHWRAYQLHVLEHRPVEEVAAAVGIQKGMVYVRKKRINDLLKKELAILESEQS